MEDLISYQRWSQTTNRPAILLIRLHYYRACNRHTYQFSHQTFQRHNRIYSQSSNHLLNRLSNCAHSRLCDQLWYPLLNRVCILWDNHLVSRSTNHQLNRLYCQLIFQLLSLLFRQVCNRLCKRAFSLAPSLLWDNLLIYN